MNSAVRQIRVDASQALLQAGNQDTVRKIDYLISDYEGELKEMSTYQRIERIAPIPIIITLFALCITIIDNKTLAGARGFIIFPIIMYVLWGLFARLMLFGPFSDYEIKYSRVKDFIRYLKEVRIQILGEEI